MIVMPKKSVIRIIPWVQLVFGIGQFWLFPIGGPIHQGLPLAVVLYPVVMLPGSLIGILGLVGGEGGLFLSVVFLSPVINFILFYRWARMREAKFTY